MWARAAHIFDTILKANIFYLATNSKDGKKYKRWTTKYYVICYLTFLSLLVAAISTTTLDKIVELE